MNELVSVVIPCYNCENYINDTLKSVLEQSYGNLEVFLVDDGSTDGTGAVLKSISDVRVHVISKANGGVSSARNAAIKEASGKYIIFVDSDDYIKPDYFQNLVEVMDNNDVQLVFTSTYSLIDGKEIFTKRTESNDLEFFCGFNEIAPAFLLGKKGHVSVWGKIYLTDVVKEIMFDEGLRVAEDLKFTVHYAEKIKKACLTSRGGYVYVIRDDSLSHDKFNKKRYDEFLCHRQLIEEYKGTETEELLKRRYVKEAINCAVKFKLGRDDLKNFRTMLKPYNNFILSTKLLSKGMKVKYLIVRYAYFLTPILRKHYSGKKEVM